MMMKTAPYYVLSMVYVFFQHFQKEDNRFCILVKILSQKSKSKHSQPVSPELLFFVSQAESTMPDRFIKIRINYQRLMIIIFIHCLYFFCEFLKPELTGEFALYISSCHIQLLASFSYHSQYISWWCFPGSGLVICLFSFCHLLSHPQNCKKTTCIQISASRTQTGIKCSKEPSVLLQSP